ncbi:pentapeptide repeat-containing protein [Actinokineospora soli]|uniref:Pentapeptide repeat-containing protein n=1 Tax=Actinokineospora soli TaxID=1048753 RepID=A0ABW2TWV5_9PSEU
MKTGLGIGAGTGGVLALLLAVRRQWHQEVTAVDTAHDATERRLTELYTKAAEQLGSEKAPVRMAGLYALERLAQDHESQRQTMVNLLCAYLRMPYDESVQEREVRLTAQRLLSAHLAAKSERFWADIDLDLSGATLIDFTLDHGDVREASFHEARFLGRTTMNWCRFRKRATFASATFEGFTSFYETRFLSSALFAGAEFAAGAFFNSTTFAVRADFSRTSFGKTPSFRNATFPVTRDRLRPPATTFHGAEFAGRVPKELKPHMSAAPAEEETE